MTNKKPAVTMELGDDGVLFRFNDKELWNAIREDEDDFADFLTEVENLIEEYTDWHIQGRRRIHLRQGS